MLVAVAQVAYVTPPVVVVVVVGFQAFIVAAPP